MIQNYDNFSKQNINFGKNLLILRNSHYLTMINTSDMWDIGRTIYNFNNNLQRFHSKKIDMRKWKRLKMIQNFFIKYSHWLLWTYLHPFVIKNTCSCPNKKLFLDKYGILKVCKFDEILHFILKWYFKAYIEFWRILNFILLNLWVPFEFG